MVFGKTMVKVMFDNFDRVKKKLESRCLALVLKHTRMQAGTNIKNGDFHVFDGSMMDGNTDRWTDRWMNALTLWVDAYIH